MMLFVLRAGLNYFYAYPTECTSLFREKTENQRSKVAGPRSHSRGRAGISGLWCLLYIVMVLFFLLQKSVPSVFAWGLGEQTGRQKREIDLPPTPPHRKHQRLYQKATEKRREGKKKQQSTWAREREDGIANGLLIQE